MRIAFLHDEDAIGGGPEYIRQLRAGLKNCETRIFFSSKGECCPRIVNQWRPDIVHINHLKAAVQYFLIPFAKRSAKVLFTVHGIHLRKYDFLPKNLKNLCARFLRLNLERWIYGQCDGLIVLTEVDRTFLEIHYKIKTKLFVIPNGVFQFDSPQGKTKLRSKWQYEYLQVARFSLQKGQDILLRAIVVNQDVLRKQEKKTLLIGGGETFEEDRKFVLENGISDLVEMTGEARHAVSLLHMGRILVCPSRWEGFPLLVCEAGLQGKCIIASDCPGNSTVIENGVSGLTFPIENVDELGRLMICDYSDRKIAELGANLEKRVRCDFPVGRMLNKTIDAYEEVLCR